MFYTIISNKLISIMAEQLLSPVYFECLLCVCTLSDQRIESWENVKHWLGSHGL